MDISLKTVVIFWLAVEMGWQLIQADKGDYSKRMSTGTHITGAIAFALLLWYVAERS